MNIEKRLQTIETKAAAIPRTLAQLLREFETLPESQHRKWYTELSDIELQVLTDEYQRQAAAGELPNYDWTALSDDELSAIVDGDMTPLETCPLLPSSNQPERAL